MGWDPVPWFIEGGAQHSANIARKLAYAALGGQEGIIGATDLEVRATAVPGTNIRVYPGAGGIRNRASGIRDEMYLGTNLTEDLVAITATSASGPRSDMIIARVENPYPTGEPWPDPTNPVVGPYIRTAVISNVGSGALVIPPAFAGYSAIPLARIDMPASTATVAQSYITDLRFMAPVQREHRQFVIQQAGTDTASETVFTLWPYALNQPVKVPLWATKASIHAVVAGARFGPGNVRGDIRSGLDTLKTQINVYDVSATTADRTDVHSGGNIDIPAALRGTTVNVYVEARKYTAVDINTSLVSDQFTTCILDIEFSAAPASNV